MLLGVRRLGLLLRERDVGGDPLQEFLEAQVIAQARFKGLRGEPEALHEPEVQGRLEPAVLLKRRPLPHVLRERVIADRHAPARFLFEHEPIPRLLAEIRLQPFGGRPQPRARVATQPDILLLKRLPRHLMAEEHAGAASRPRRRAVARPQVEEKRKRRHHDDGQDPSGAVLNRFRSQEPSKHRAAILAHSAGVFKTAPARVVYQFELK